MRALQTTSCSTGMLRATESSRVAARHARQTSSSSRIAWFGTAAVPCTPSPDCPCDGCYRFPTSTTAVPSTEAANAARHGLVWCCMICMQRRSPRLPPFCDKVRWCRTACSGLYNLIHHLESLFTLAPYARVRVVLGGYGSGTEDVTAGAACTPLAACGSRRISRSISLHLPIRLPTCRMLAEEFVFFHGGSGSSATCAATLWCQQLLLRPAT
jgi:hypothetical protein